MATNKDDGKPKKVIHRVMIDSSKDDFYADAYTVLDKENLNFFDPVAHSNKFYIIEVHQSNAGKGYRLYVNHGRNGAKGCEIAQPFPSVDAAKKMYAKKLREKLNKGYVHVEMATTARGSAEGKKLVDEKGIAGVVDLTKTVKTGTSLPKSVQSLITKIYAEANQAVSLSLSASTSNKDISTPLGNLGINGINRSREILHQLQRSVLMKDSNAISNYSVQYFRYTPRQMSLSDQKAGKWLLSTQDRIQKELEILDLYEDTLRLLPVMGTSDFDVKYRGLACDIVPVNAQELDYVKHKVCDSIASNHHYRLAVTDAWNINQHNAPAFNSAPGNVRHLFHGSRSANIVGILSSYLKLPNNISGVVKTGQLFGNGIYLASNSSKSFNYSAGSWCGRANKYDTAYLFIAEVAMGNVYKTMQPHSFSVPPAGYHSVMGCKGGSLINDEFIVYNPAQVSLKYLVECKKV